MIDLSGIPDEVLRARGAYSTIRGEYDRELQKLRKLCEDTQTNITQLLLAAQNPKASHKVSEIFLELMSGVTSIGNSVTTLKELQYLKGELRLRAWEDS